MVKRFSVCSLVLLVGLSACETGGATTKSIPKDGGVHTSDKVFDDALWSRDFEASITFGLDQLKSLQGANVDARIRNLAVTAANSYSDQAKSLRDQLSFAYRTASQDYSQAESAEERDRIRASRDKIVTDATEQLDRSRTINSLITAFVAHPTDAAFEELTKTIRLLALPRSSSGLDSETTQPLQRPELVSTPDEEAATKKQNKKGELRVSRIVASRLGTPLDEKNLATKLFDITIENSTPVQSVSRTLEARYTYQPGGLLAIGHGEILRPVAKYTLTMPIDFSETGEQKVRLVTEPALIFPAGTPNEPSLTTFRLAINYDTNGRAHPTPDWDLYWSLDLTDDRSRRLPLFLTQSWRRQKYSQRD